MAFRRPSKCFIDFIERVFCNLGIDTWLRIFSIGGVLVNEKEVYRERIIEMVKKTENNDMLRFVYIVVSELKGIVEDEHTLQK